MSGAGQLRTERKYQCQGLGQAGDRLHQKLQTRSHRILTLTLLYRDTDIMK